MEYDNSHNKKFVLGVVLKLGKYNYFAPITHYKIQRPNNILIDIKTDKYNPIKGSIRFNYMLPVLPQFLTEVKINKIVDTKHKRLLYKEYDFCLNHQEIIRQKALKTYLDVIMGTDESLRNNSCDFNLLEQACDDYTN